MDELQVRRAVRDAYGARAGGCCDPQSGASCGTASGSDIAKLGVGDPLALAGLHAGEVVLDLGSGPGRDVLEAARQVAPDGRAIGVDATPEMVLAARETARELRLANAEFRLGEIEHLPVESGTVDVVVSDCVINLSPDKGRVFREAFRVLRPGGRIVVSDVVADADLPPAIREDARAWAACIAGAVAEEEYVRFLREAGFEAIRVDARTGRWAQGLHAAVIMAHRPSA